MAWSYPPDFVERIEDEYGDWPEILQLAKNNKYLLGKFLAEGASSHMPPEDIVHAFENNESEKILSEAQSSIRRQELHRDWLKMMVNKVESLQIEEPKSRRFKKHEERKSDQESSTDVNV